MNSLTTMRNIYEKIHELAEIPGFSKHEQLVKGIINAIDEKLLSKGDMLPSVNTMNKELGFAKETIVKAYAELKSRGIIEARNRLGFYITNEDTEQTLKLALMMYGYDTFQEQFYTNFRNGLGDNVHLDVFFHHGNIEVFETIFDHIKGKYGMYVISPIPHPRTAALLQSIPPNKFLMFDRYEPMEGDFCHITQEFEQSSYAAFAALADTIRQYDEFIFFYHPDDLIPIEILRAFKKFVQDFGIKGGLRAAYTEGSIEKGKAYFSIDNTELFKLIKETNARGWVLGKDVGILSHNDEPVKELIGGGITTFSTDFALMGKRAAEYVLNREKIQETIPTLLIQRNSI